MIPSPRAKYFEEFNVGDEFTTSSRTVTEADIVLFTGLSWDNAAMHTDEEYAKSFFKGRIAQGLLTVSMFSGLRAKLGIVDGTVAGFLGMTVRFPNPVLIGDTITAKMVVAEKRLTSKGDRGVMKSNISVVNQRGEVVVEGDETLMVVCRPTK